MEDEAVKTGRPKRAFGWLVLLLVGYLGIAAIVGSRVGLQFDEVNFAVAALGVEDPGNFFVRHRTTVGSLTVPAAISSYRGALKAWVYAPVLREVGRSPMLVRLTSAGLFALFLLALWIGLRPWCGGRVAVGIVGLLLLHPEVLWCSIFDWGPVVWGLLGAGVGTLSLVAIHRRALAGRLVSASFLAILPGLAYGLAIFDKASNLWLVGSCGLALLFAAPGRWIAPRGLVVVPGLALGALAACWPMIDYNLVAHGETGTYPTLQASTGPGAGDLFATFRQSLGGVGAFSFVRGGDEVELLHPLLWILGTLPFMWWRLRGYGEAARLRFFVVLAGLLIFGMARSPQPIGPHHAVFLVAALLLLIGSTVGALIRTEHIADHLLGVGLLSFTLFCSAALSSGQGVGLYLNSGRSGWNVAHTEWLENLPRPEKRFVIMDWGITAPLTLTQGRDTRFSETYFAFDSKDPAKRERLVTWMKDLAGDPANLLLLHGAEHTRTPGARDLMNALLAKNELDLELVSLVRGPVGESLGIAVRAATADTPPERRIDGRLP